MIETDIRFTFDRQAVLFHDETIFRDAHEGIDKTSKRRKVEDMFLEEIKKLNLKMNTFAELVDWLKKNEKIKIIFDLPNDRKASFDDISIIYSTLYSKGLLSRSFWLTSPFRIETDLRVFQSLSKSSPSFVYSFDPFIQESLDYLPQLGFLFLLFIFFFKKFYIFFFFSLKFRFKIIFDGQYTLLCQRFRFILFSFKNSES